MTLVKLQSERAASFSVRWTSLEGTVTERESSVTESRDKLSALQTQMASFHKAVAVLTEPGASAAGRVKELERSPLSAENDLHNGQTKRHTMKAKESHLPDICKGLGGQVVVHIAELRADQDKFVDLASLRDGASGSVNTVLAKRNMAGDLEATAIRNLWAAEVAREALSSTLPLSGREQIGWRRP